MTMFLALLSALLGSVAAHAAFPAFNQCSVRNTRGVEIVNTTLADGKPYFRSGQPVPIFRHGEARLRAEFVWSDGIKSAQPKLWIVHETYHHVGIVGENAVVSVRQGGVEVPLEHVTFKQKGGAAIFELDPQALLDRYAGQDSLKLIIRSRSGNPGFKLESQWFPREQIDLVRLREQLEAHRAAIDVTVPCQPLTAALMAEVDAKAYTQCRLSVVEDGVNYFSFGDGIQWQYGLPAQSFYIDSRPLSAVDEEEPTFLQKLADPRQSPIDFRSKYTVKRYSVQLRFVLSFGGQPYVPPVDKYGEAHSDLATLAKLETQGGAIAVETFAPDGKRVERFLLPAKLFQSIPDRLIAMKRKLLQMKTDPMQFCAPEEPIIVT